MQDSGYSGKRLASKLGIKAAGPVVINAPAGYEAHLGMAFREELGESESFVQWFVTDALEAERAFRDSMPRLDKAGQLWISWPKRSSKLSTGLGENQVRDIGLAAGLVDAKVAAIDEDWSGLKFVFRLKDR